MPSWLPGDDYMTNFKVGDPYVQIDDGYARLPGAGYEALHPELKDVNPEDYPDIHKLRILSDVAPYSREYNQGSLSCLAQKLSRTRARPKRRSGSAQHSGSALRLSARPPASSLVLSKARKLEWSLRPAGHKNPLPRAGGEAVGCPVNFSQRRLRCRMSRLVAVGITLPGLSGSGIIPVLRPLKLAPCPRGSSGKSSPSVMSGEC